VILVGRGRFEARLERGHVRQYSIWIASHCVASENDADQQ